MQLHTFMQQTFETAVLHFSALNIPTANVMVHRWRQLDFILINNLKEDFFSHDKAHFLTRVLNENCYYPRGYKSTNRSQPWRWPHRVRCCTDLLKKKKKLTTELTVRLDLTNTRNISIFTFQGKKNSFREGKDMAKVTHTQFESRSPTSCFSFL